MTLSDRRQLVALVVLAAVFALLPVVGVDEQWQLYVFLFSIYLALATMWNLLAGYSGLISLCQPAFIGFATYTLVIVTWSGFDWWVGILAGMVASAVVALVIAIPSFRMKGVYFAIGTLVFPEIFRLIFYLWRPVGGELHGKGAGYVMKGVDGITTTHTYYMAIVIGLVAVFVMYFVLRSKLGLGLAAIRDNDLSSAASGINVFRVKMASFVISAVISGIAGCVFYIYQGFVEPNSAFSISWTMTLILATVIGGIGIEMGPLVGTAVVVILNFALAQTAGYSLLIQGVILVIIMVVAPRGILGLTPQLWFRRRAEAPEEEVAEEAGT